jgi:hypothetical protein
MDTLQFRSVGIAYYGCAADVALVPLLSLFSGVYEPLQTSMDLPAVIPWAMMASCRNSHSCEPYHSSSASAIERGVTVNVVRTRGQNFLSSRVARAN